MACLMFWSSVDLTGNQTFDAEKRTVHLFWSSVDLTGNQTLYDAAVALIRFGAVSI